MKLNKIILFFLFLISGTLVAQNKLVDKIVAVIGNEIVLHSDFENSRLQALSEGLTVDDKFTCFLYDDLFMNKMLVHYAKVDSLEVPEDRIDAEIDAKMRIFIQQFGSAEKLEEFYNKSILEIKEEFRELIKANQLAEAMRRKVTGEINVTPSEVEKFFYNIPVDSLPYINLALEIQQIVIKPPISLEEKERVRAELSKWRDEIVSGKKRFKTVAGLYSEDPGSGSKGGELGMTPRGSFAPEFEAVAYGLEEGEVSEVFETQFGFHIVQLIERRGESINCRHILRIPKVTPGDLEIARLQMDSVYKELQDTLKFDDAIRLYSTDEDTKKNRGLIVNPYTGGVRIDMSQINQVDPHLFYTIKNLKLGEVSRPSIYQNREGKQAYRVLRIAKRIEPHQANLKQDYQLIKSAALAEKEKEVVSEWMEDKISTTYIKIDEELEDCVFNFNWVINPDN